MSAWAIVRAWDAQVPPVTKLILLCIAESTTEADDEPGVGDWYCEDDKPLIRIAVACGITVEAVSETLAKLIRQGAFRPVGYGYHIHFDELRRNRRSVKGGL